jgi:hypothetical protein
MKGDKNLKHDSCRTQMTAGRPWQGCCLCLWCRCVRPLYRSWDMVWSAEGSESSFWKRRWYEFTYDQTIIGIDQSVLWTLSLTSGPDWLWSPSKNPVLTRGKEGGAWSWPLTSVWFWSLICWAQFWNVSNIGKRPLGRPRRRWEHNVPKGNLVGECEMDSSGVG